MSTTEQSPAKVIDDLLKTHVTPALKERGFRKIGRTYYRQHESWQELINVQANRWNSAGDGMFTINVGVFHEPTSQAVWGKYAPQVPHEYDCQTRSRIGRLLGEGDKWWAFNDKTDLSALGQDVLATLGEPVQAYFNQFQSLSDILAAVKQSGHTNAPVPSRMRAALAFYAGDQAGSLNYLEAGAQTGEARREAADTAKRLGLPFDPPQNEDHLTLSLFVSPETEVKAAGKLADAIHLRILNMLTAGDSMYLYDRDFTYPTYTFELYGADATEMRERLAKVMIYAQKKFGRVELT